MTSKGSERLWTSAVSSESSLLTYTKIMGLIEQRRLRETQNLPAHTFTKMKDEQPAKAQRRLSKSAVWPKSSLLIRQVTTEGSGETVHKCSLVKIFLAHTKNGRCVTNEGSGETVHKCSLVKSSLLTHKNEG